MNEFKLLTAESPPIRLAYFIPEIQVTSITVN